MSTFFESPNMGSPPPAPANDNAEPPRPDPAASHATRRAAGPGSAGRPSRAVPHRVIDGLDGQLPVRHEEAMIAGPLIEAVLEKLQAQAANDNDGEAR